MSQRGGTAHLPAAGFLLLPPPNQFPSCELPARCYCCCCCCPCAGPWRSNDPGASPSPVSQPLEVAVGCGRARLEPSASVSWPLGREGGNAQLPGGGQRCHSTERASSGPGLSPLPPSPDHHFYDESKPFTCLDGSATIPFDQVNDDYCDCRDGSDEPGELVFFHSFIHSFIRSCVV